jgi:hypothetical protein
MPIKALARKCQSHYCPNVNFETFFALIRNVLQKNSRKEHFECVTFMLKPISTLHSNSRSAKFNTDLLRPGLFHMFPTHFFLTAFRRKLKRTYRRSFLGMKKARNTFFKCEKEEDFSRVIMEHVP